MPGRITKKRATTEMNSLDVLAFRRRLRLSARSIHQSILRTRRRCFPFCRTFFAPFLKRVRFGVPPWQGKMGRCPCLIRSNESASNESCCSAPDGTILETSAGASLMVVVTEQSS